jgi:hypothetical protein
MKAKVYIETTIPSYLVGRPSRDLVVAAHQEITRNWWESSRSEFDLYVSELVLTEVRAGEAHLASRRLELMTGIPLLPVSSQILELAERFNRGTCDSAKSGARCGTHCDCTFTAATTC